MNFEKPVLDQDIHFASLFETEDMRRLSYWY